MWALLRKTLFRHGFAGRGSASQQTVGTTMHLSFLPWYPATLKLRPMKRPLSAAIALVFAASLLPASRLFAQTPQAKASVDFTYTLVSSDGTNGAAVAWHPGLNLFFTVIAGNAEFPLEGFSKTGQNSYSAEAGVDVRGLWYNPGTGNLEGNAAGEAGWFSISFNRNMTAHQASSLVAGQYQPDFQSVGAYNSGEKKVAYFNPVTEAIDLYPSKKPSKVKSVPLKLSSCGADALNQTSLGYTGVKDFEYVFLNYNDHKLVFVNKAGQETATTALPEELASYGAFKFAFAAGRVFLYEVENRTWTALKVF